MKIIEKIGFFRLTLIPLGLVILLSAYRNGIWGMGIIGAIVIIFGTLNKCLLLGQCDIDDNSHPAIRRKKEGREDLVHHNDFIEAFQKGRKEPFDRKVFNRKKRPNSTQVPTSKTLKAL